MFKNLVQRRLENYVVKYFKKHPEVKLILVAGSVGKTTSRNAIATVLSQRYRVRMATENYNSEISAPLAMLGIELPRSLRNPLAWWGVFRAARTRVTEPADVDVIVQEIGVDHPGEMKQYLRYLKADIAVVTGVTPEHMEFFHTLDAVAKEELSILQCAKLGLINRDDIDSKYADLLVSADFRTYGTSGSGEYHFELTEQLPREGAKGLVTIPGHDEPLPVSTRMLGEHTLRPVMAAVACGAELGLTREQIAQGVEQIQPVLGRMNPLSGLNDTVVIDDTYNSSPAALEAALQTLYHFDMEPQRIAVLGSMNELGPVSADEHARLGALCSPDLLAWVVVVGDEAAKHLAPAAKQRGCQVKICRDAIEAGEFVRSIAEPGSVILVKGSQGGIYLEETVKILCDITEHDKLVRQSAHWQEIKQRHFSQFVDD